MKTDVILKGTWREGRKNNGTTYITNGVYEYEVIDPKRLKDKCYKYYLYYEILSDGSLALKFGEVYKSSIYERNSDTNLRGLYSRIIRVWECKDGDAEKRNCDKKYVHNAAKGYSETWYAKQGWKPLEKDGEINTTEGYIITSPFGVENFIEFISNRLGKAAIKRPRKVRVDFKDIQQYCSDMIRLNEQKGIRYFLGDFAMRFGKTSFALRFLRESNNRVMVVPYYIHTAGTGYKNEVEDYEHNKNLRWYDTKDGDWNEESVNKWMEDENHKVAFGLPLTDSDCKGGTFNRRLKSIKPFIEKYNSCLFVDEADYGADKKRQRAKIEKLYSNEKFKFTSVMVMTGTDGFLAAERIFNGMDFHAFHVTYYDILQARCGVGVDFKWYTATNDILPQTLRDDIEYECWSKMYEIVDGKFVGERFIRGFLTSLLRPDILEEHLGAGRAFGLKYDMSKVYEFSSKLNTFGATLIFGPNTIEGMNKLAGLLRELFKGTGKEVFIINSSSDCTCADSETNAKKKLDGVDPSNIVFIADMMVFRSWSVPEVKNIIMMCDGGSCNTVAQKAGRAFTPWCVNGEYDKEHNTATIFDFMFSIGEPTCRDNMIAWEGATSALKGEFANVRFAGNYYVYYTEGTESLFREVTEEEKRELLMSNGEYMGYAISRLSPEIARCVTLTEEGVDAYYENKKSGALSDGNLDKTILGHFFDKKVRGKRNTTFTKVSSKAKEEEDDANDEEEEFKIKKEMVLWVYENRYRFSVGEEGYDTITDEWFALCADERGLERQKSVCEKNNRDFNMVNDVFTVFKKTQFKV